MTPLTSKLFTAIRRGDVDQVEQLLAQGADIHGTNHAGETPLHIAAFKDDANVARVLLGAGANVNAINHAGETPLYLLVPHFDHEIAGVLLEAGADPNVPNAAGETMLLTALDSSQTTPPARVLLDHGADPNAANEAGTTPLHMAAEHFDDAAAGLLLARGARIHATDARGATPLHKAADSDHSRIVTRLLIEHQAPLNTPDNAGNTPLHYAAIAGAEENIRLLLAAGADPQITNNMGETPRVAAIRADQLSGVERLLQAGVPLGEDERCGLAVLYKQKLHAHSQTQRRGVLEALTGAGLDTNGPVYAESNQTLLHVLCANPNVPSDDIALLLASGAHNDVNQTDDAGNTPAHQYLARKLNRTIHLAGLRSLLEYGTEVACMNRDGRTLYQVAQDRGLFPVCDLLEEHGAVPAGMII